MGTIVSWNELSQIIGHAKAEGKTIVFTNGCFDILHIGHVRYLREAKSYGDVLIIGLNSDKSVSRIKPGRPVLPQEQRAEVLAALEIVDYVTLFSEDTPYELIRLVQPDVLVKGGDWKKEDIVGSDIAKKTLSLPYVKGVSTSAIIEQIKNA
ncbi:MAG: D-glycero-beta-D-manno-heptose 1-phosphate adenylyltransferase [Nitrospirota bacterium]